MSSQVQAFVWTYVFSLLGKYPRSGIAGSCGKCIFNFVRNRQTVIPKWLYMIFSLQQEEGGKEIYLAIV